MVSDQLRKLVTQLQGVEERRNKICAEFDSIMDQIQALTGTAPAMKVLAAKAPSKISGLSLGTHIQDFLEETTTGVTKEDLVKALKSTLRQIAVSLRFLVDAGKAVIDDEGLYYSASAYQAIYGTAAKTVKAD